MDTSKLSSKEILTLIKQEIHRDAQKPEPGYKTTAEWAREWDLAESRTREIIRGALKAEIMVCREYRTGCGGRKVPHYAYRGKAKPGKLPDRSR